MGRTNGSTVVHKTGRADEIIDILMDKGAREGYDKYLTMINEKFDLDLSKRQLRYFYNNYVLPLERVTPGESKEAIEDQREMVNVAVEQMDIYEEQKERLHKLMDLDVRELLKEANEHLGPDDYKKTRLSIIKKKATMIRQEMEVIGQKLRDLKGTKQDLGLMKKEPDKLDIKKKEETDVNMEDFGSDEIKEIAMAMAGVDDGAE